MALAYAAKLRQFEKLIVRYLPFVSEKKTVLVFGKQKMSFYLLNVWSVSRQGNFAVQNEKAAEIVIWNRPAPSSAALQYFSSISVRTTSLQTYVTTHYTPCTIIPGSHSTGCIHTHRQKTSDPSHHQWQQDLAWHGIHLIHQPSTMSTCTWRLQMKLQRVKINSIVASASPVVSNADIMVAAKISPSNHQMAMSLAVSINKSEQP